MEVKQELIDNALTLLVDDRLDIATSPILEKAVQGIGDSVRELTFDFTKLDYISSAGIRVVLLAIQKMTGRGAKTTIVGANKQVRDVFSLTGLDSFLTFK